MNKSQHPHKRIYDIAHGIQRGWLSGQKSFDYYSHFKNEYKKRGWFHLWLGAWESVNKESEG